MQWSSCLPLYRQQLCSSRCGGGSCRRRRRRGSGAGRRRSATVLHAHRGGPLHARRRTLQLAQSRRPDVPSGLACLESTSGRRSSRALRCYPPVSKTMMSKLPGAQLWRTCTSNDGESRASGLYVNGDTHEVCTEAEVREAFTTDVTQLPVSGCDGLILSLRSTTSERRHRPSITIRVTPRQRRAMLEICGSAWDGAYLPG